MRQIVRKSKLVLALTLTLTSITVPRAGAQTVSPSIVQDAIGKEVTVTGQDGTRRKGRLLSITATEVAIRLPGRSMSLPLGTVREVQRGSHAVTYGAGIGLAAGVGIAVAICTGGGNGNCVAEGYDESFITGALLGGIGAGAGAAIGAVVRASSRASRTIYKAPAKVTVALTPAFGRASLGLAGTITW